jgi:AcrR family transcriptional regulator
MRISKEKKRENIESVFQAAIKLSKDRSFDSLTMKAIAKEAGIGEATIYNYFPKKEMIITGYLDWSIEEAIRKTENEPFDDPRFTETLHTLIENHLEILEPAKAFFAESVQSLFINPISLANTSVAETKKRHFEFVSREFSLAVQRGEFPQPPFGDFLLALVWDYHVGLLYYWLKDDAEASMRTTELVSLSMNVFEELLRSDLFNKVYSVAHFLFKEHILNQLLSPKEAKLER